MIELFQRRLSRSTAELAAEARARLSLKGLASAALAFNVPRAIHGGRMYTIRYYRDGEQLDREWRGDLSEAKDLVVGYVAVGSADRAEVCDTSGQLIFCYPRITRRA